MEPKGKMVYFLKMGLTGNDFNRLRWKDSPKNKGILPHFAPYMHPFSTFCKGVGDVPLHPDQKLAGFYSRLKARYGGRISKEKVESM